MNPLFLSLQIQFFETQSGWPEKLTAIGTISLAFITFILAFIAIFPDWIRSLVWKPKLEMSLTFSPPFCHKTSLNLKRRLGILDFIHNMGITSGWGGPIQPQFGQQPDNQLYLVEAYYFRFKVENTGNLRAENAEIIAEELWKTDDGELFQKVDWFLPTNLLWTHIEKPFVEAISPKTSKLCNLGFIVRPDQRIEADEIYDNETYEGQTLLNLTLEVLSNHKGHLIPPGKYRLKLKIAAANAKPESAELEINFTGDWNDDETTMFENYIQMRKL